MWLFYLIMFNMVLTAIIYGVKVNTKIASLLYLTVNLGMLCFLSMFRSIEVGIDSDNYALLFYQINNLPSITEFLTRYEIGYIIFNKLIGFLFDSHQALFICSSLCIFFIVGRFIYRYSAMGWLSLILFFSMRYYDIAVSGLRQMLAIATLLIAYDFIVKKKPIKFAILVLLATSFHSAAMIFLIAYPLSMLKLNKKIFLRSLIISIILFLFLDQLLTLLFRYFPRYISYYDSEEVKLVTVLGLLIMVSILIVGEMINRKIQFKDSRYGPTFFINNRQDQIQAIFVFIACIIMFLALQIDIFQRFKNIFGIFSIIYLPNAIYKIRNKSMKSLMVLTTIVFFFLHITIIHIYRPEWQSSFPYFFFWSK